MEEIIDSIAHPKKFDFFDITALSSEFTRSSRLTHAAMHNFHWTAAEKKAARKAFDSALQVELNSFIAEFKAKAHAVQEVAAIWEISDWLDERARQIDAEYDYRYSQLILVFAKLVRQRKLSLSDLAGLSEDKLQAIQHIAEL